eukprot:2378595-Pleurochrysis_carterae.AAC.1
MRATLRSLPRVGSILFHERQCGRTVALRPGWTQAPSRARLQAWTGWRVCAMRADGSSLPARIFAQVGCFIFAQWRCVDAEGGLLAEGSSE